VTTVDSAERSERSSLESALEHARHLLPSQAPLHAFVHHNTLHAFEDRTFDDAVVAASKIYGTEPYQSEHAFAECIRNGRIHDTDLREVIVGDPTVGDGEVFPGGPARRDLRLFRLRHLFEIPRNSALRWTLDETDALLRFCPEVTPERRRELLAEARLAVGVQADRSEPALQAALLGDLWRALDAAVPAQEQRVPCPRVRDRVLAATGVDTDEIVQPLLIRLAGAFLDQGLASWSMPDREAGFLVACRRLYGLTAVCEPHGLGGLSAILREHEAQSWSADQTVEWALGAMGIPDEERGSVIDATLLSLRGWAGMVHTFETRPDLAPVEARPARLMDYLAVQLTLDVAAARRALANDGNGLEMSTLADSAPMDRVAEDSFRTELVYEAFILSQIVPFEISQLLKPDNARAWVGEVRQFNGLERRRLLHLAYERRHRMVVLDGLAAHCRLGEPSPPEPEFQAVFCIDDREESLRRHLEECAPAVETFGFAGFFGVPMAYQGMEDLHPRPLCPVTIVPRHVVREFPLQDTSTRDYERANRATGQRKHFLTRASHSLFSGGIVTSTIGVASLVPIIGRCMFPRAFEKWTHRLAAHRPARPPTRLQLEYCAESSTAKMQAGFHVAEMVEIVANTLETMSIGSLCPIVLIVGHGSSSLNNPHEAAHDCGATGGGRGGPNARAFAAMANHPEVRAGLSAMGQAIPEGTWFVGAYHNTADGAVLYFDEDLVPSALTEPFGEVKRKMAEASVLDAHERCRRFESGPRGYSLGPAVAHTESRSIDLAQPRPEYGHATNAVCIVGRRARTRGLFLDRRAFLVSYDPDQDDDEGSVLTRLLLSVGPVGAGINLEYYFSFVDPVGYGCGTKLPHNISGLFGVMDGHASDLRTGLPWQMVEIHEPVRLLTIVEAKRSLLEKVLEETPALDRLIRNGWIQFIAWDPDSDALHVFDQGAFEAHQPESLRLPAAIRSADYYTGTLEHLAPAHITAAFGTEPMPETPRATALARTF